MIEMCDIHQRIRDHDGSCAVCEWIGRANLDRINPNENSILKIEGGKVNYIATYQAESVDGATFQNNAVLHSVAEGTAPEKIIEAVFEQASVDMAHRGMAITSVILLNLSRVY